jgi:ribosomal protein S18 acetylase RimI-like enzyme
MIVRRALAADAPGFGEVIDAAYAPYLHLGLPAVSEGIADDIRDHTVLVAEAEGRLLGGVVVILGNTAHIANLAVHPDASGMGIGKTLMAAAMTAAQDAGHGSVSLATHMGMTGTQAFYRKTGWAETGREGNKVYFSKELN